MVNKVILLGNLGKDPEVRMVKDAKVATFSLATSETYKDKQGQKQEVTEWHSIVVWRGLADIAEKYLHKGDKVYIEGKLRTRHWETDKGDKRSSTDIIADTLLMLGSASKSAPTAAPAPKAAPARTTPMLTAQDVSQDADEDLPF